MWWWTRRFLSRAGFRCHPAVPKFPRANSDTSAITQGIAMQTFTFRPERWWIVRAFGRNPLIRVSDRVEIIVMALALVGCVIAAPIAGAVGTAVYDSRRQLHSEQTTARHPVMATALKDSTTVVDGTVATNSFYTVSARWRSDATEHTESFDWPHFVEAGDHIEIWVDDHGNRVAVPSLVSQPGIDGAGAGVMLWLSAVAAAATLTAGMRWQLARLRSAEWERDLRSLQTNGGGRTNTQP